jgi:hypothetical protein
MSDESETRDYLRVWSESVDRLRAELDAWESERHELAARIRVRREFLAALDAEMAMKAPRRLFTPEPPLPAVVDAGEATATLTTAPGSHGEPTGAPVGPRLTTASTGEVAFSIVSEAGRPISNADVIEVMRERGLLPDVKKPGAAIGSALWYLAHKGRIVAIGSKQNRRWVLASQGAEVPSQEGDIEADTAGGGP